jgi:DNA polymerase kappa
MSDATFLSGNRTKAGLPENNGLERHRIDEIIKETSVGSRYYQFQERHEKKIEERVAKLLHKREQLEKSFQKDEETFHRQDKDLERWIEIQEINRDLTRTFVHIDMDGIIFVRASLFSHLL